MSYIVCSKLGLQFGGRVILHDVDLAIQEHDRIGLVGPNGAGKSTLLKILNRELNPNEGQVSYAKKLRVGYLPQDIQELVGDTLLDSVLAAVPGRVELEERLKDVEDALDHAESTEEQIELSQALADVHEELNHFEDLFSPHEALRIIDGLGFREADLDRPVAEFSGGWKMRAALAGILFQQPEVLLLDEPTNHLDIPSVEWLDAFLRNYRHAFVIICHDRSFLNEQVNRIVSFEVEGVRSYPGDYNHYLVQREEELRVLENRAKNQERQRKNIENYVARFRVSARRSSQAQSRLKVLDKMETIELPSNRKTLKFRFPPVERSGEVVVKTEGLCKAFGETVLYDGIDLNVMRGDRIGIIGVNGAGKTTLLRMLAGELDPDAGTIEYGHRVNPGYYAQHHTDILSPQNTVLREVMYSDKSVSEQFARTILGAMMFSGDDVEKPISVLSGGEKARTALATLLVKPRNLLMMDEPTNHLDLDSSEALAAALDTYEGTLIFVSHNRAFVNSLATKIWDIADGKVTEYPGNLTEYLDHQHRRAAQGQNGDVQIPASDEAPAQQTETKPRAQSAKRSREEDKVRRRKMQKLRREVEQLEERIGKLEASQSERERKLSLQEVYENQVLFQSVLKDFEADRDELARLMPRWEEKQGELEAIEREIAAAE